MDGNPPGTNGHHRSGPPLKRPRLRAVFTNMRARMPLHRKLYLLFRNNWVKIRTGHDCCGHPGQPGC